MRDDTSEFPRTREPGRVFAHRGASQDAPENTLAAVRLAAEQGARWIEFDVSLLGDGAPVMHHDATLDRCTDGTGPLTGITAADVAGLDAGSWKSPVYAGEPLPTLAEVLDLIEELGLSANLEMKPHDGQRGALSHAVKTALDARPWTLERIVTSSFDLDELARFRGMCPDAPVAALYVDPPADWRRVLSGLRASALHLHYAQIRESLLIEAATHGFDVRVYTINDPEVIAPFRDQGLTSVITDHPPLFLEHEDWRSWTGS